MVAASQLLLRETLNQPKVTQFLDSVARNSIKTKQIYAVGLSHFQTFLSRTKDGQTLETIIDLIIKNDVNVYVLLDSLVSYLLDTNRLTKLSRNSVGLYVACVRSFLQYHDVEISPSKFKRRVRIPKNHREDEEPLDASDIRRLLLSCNNRRLKSYLLILASGGMRTAEALAIRIKDIDFSVQPTKIHIRKEYSKTRVARDIYVSDEATKFLKEWIQFRYRNRGRNPTPKVAPDDLVFTRSYFRKNVDPRNLYLKISEEFHNLLRTVGMDELKEGMNRRKFTPHSIRRMVKSVISIQAGQDYSEWFLGHNKSPYWTIKEAQRREIYQKQVMPFLTFLDYNALENTSKGIVSQLEQKDREITYLSEKIRENQAVSADTINNLSDKLMEVTARLDKLEKK